MQTKKLTKGYEPLQKLNVKLGPSDRFTRLMYDHSFRGGCLVVCFVARVDVSLGSFILVFVQTILGSVTVDEWAPFGKMVSLSLNHNYVLIVSCLSVAFIIAISVSRSGFRFLLCQSLVISYYSFFFINCSIY